MQRFSVSALRSQLYGRGALTVSLFARLGFGLIMFIVLARLLPAEDFGFVAFAVSLGTLWGASTDWGQSFDILRRIVKRPSSTAIVVERAFYSKIILSLASYPLIFSLSFLPTLSGHLGLAQLIYLSCFFSGLSEILVSVLRARGRYFDECLIAVASGVAGIACPLAAAFIWVSPIEVSWGLFFGRLLALIMVFSFMWKAIVPSRWSTSHFRGIGLMIRKNAALAADGILVTFYNQVDSFITGSLLSGINFANYQAGSRFMQAISPLASMLAVSNLPKTTNALRDKSISFIFIITMVMVEFAFVGFVAGMMFYFLGPYLNIWLFKNKFVFLNGLWGGFAAATMVRFCAGGAAVILMAYHRERYLIVPRALSITVLITGGVIFIPLFGIHSVPYLLWISGVTLMVGNMIALTHTGHGKILIWIVSAVSLVLSFLFLVAPR